MAGLIEELASGRSCGGYGQKVRAARAMERAVAFRLPARGLDDVLFRVQLAVEHLPATELEKQRRRQILRGWRSCADALANAYEGQRAADIDSALASLEELLRLELFNEEPVGL